jgi:hypothetical protein
LPDGLVPGAPLRDVRTRPPSEFVGLARLFRNEIKRVDTQFEQALRAIAAPLKARLKRHIKLRDEMVADAIRRYQTTVPAAYRYGPLAIVRDRARFGIGEVRLCATWLREQRWEGEDPTEPGIAVARMGLEMFGCKLVLPCRPLGVVSLHALARRIERGEDRSHEALVRDLGLLIDAGPDGTRVECRDGAWIGGLIPMQGENTRGEVRHIRTFHS